jgi:hypothetical protein
MPTSSSHLQRLQASTSSAETLTAASAAVPSAPVTDTDNMTFLSPEERSTLSNDQKLFMVRKRKAAMGLGPVMPEFCSCEACSGVGLTVCHQCGGAGFNSCDKAAEMFRSEGEILIYNGMLNPQWLFRANGPCWLCKGGTFVACAECAGTGIKGGVDRYTGD